MFHKEENNWLDLLADASELNPIDTMTEPHIETDGEADYPDDVSDEEDIKPTHGVLMDCLKTLGYQVNPRGICTGFSYAAALSFLSNHNLNIFYNRLGVIHAISDNIKEVLDRNKVELRNKRIGSFQSNILTYNQQMLINIDAFFDTINIAQEYPILDGFGSNTNSNFSTFSNINATAEIEKSGRLVADKNWQLEDVYSSDELSQYLSELDRVAKAQTRAFVVSLAAFGHMCLLCYEPKSGWTFVDCNAEEAITETNAENLSITIWDALVVVADEASEDETDSDSMRYGETDSNYLMLISNFMTTGDSKDEIQNMFEHLRNSSVLQNINLTLDKTFSVNRQGNVVHLAAKSGSDRLLKEMINLIRNDTSVSLEKREALLKEHLNAKSITDASFVHMAAYFGYEDVTRTLCENGCEMRSEETKNHFTPAHEAAAHGHTGILEILASFGIDLCQPNSLGRSPLDIAKEKNQLEVVAFLEQYAINKSKPINIADDHFSFFGSKRSHDTAIETDKGLDKKEQVAEPSEKKRVV